MSTLYGRCPEASDLSPSLHYTALRLMYCVVEFVDRRQSLTAMY